jgi:hypothetical protein
MPPHLPTHNTNKGRKGENIKEQADKTQLQKAIAEYQLQ